MYSTDSRGVSRKDTVEICTNGHIIHRGHRVYGSKSPEKFCKFCSAKIIEECLNCEKLIPNTITSNSLPDFCPYCSEPFPWKGKLKTQNTNLIAESPVKILRRIFSRFHLVVRELRNRHAGRTTLDVADEYDVQDLLSALLILHFDDIRPEEWTSSYAGQSARMDFLLKNEKIVIEVKMTRKGLGDKEIGNQLIIDIERYKNHPDCDTLMCFIYDPKDCIKNNRGLTTDLEKKSSSQFKIIVIIYP